VKNSLRAFWVAAVVSAGVWFGLAAPAHAELVLSLNPGVGIGITDNANNFPTDMHPQGALYGVGNFGAILRFERAASIYSVTYNLQYTHFLTGPGADTVTNGLGLAAVFHLSARLDLSLLANAGFSRTSAVNTVDLTNPLLPTQVNLVGANLYVIGAVAETLSYQPTARRNFRQTLAANQIQFVNTNLPNATTVVLDLRGTQAAARDNFFIDFDLADAYSTHVPVAMQVPFTQGNIFTTHLNFGWRRDYNPFWYTELIGGPAAVFKLDGTAVISPAVSAALTYQRRPWFATAIAGQAPALNLYLGAITINDQVSLRLALPLDQADRFFVVGYAAYVYGRIPTEQDRLARAFDTRSAGATITAKARRLPLIGSLQYTFSDQHGGNTAVGGIATIERQTLLLSVGGVFAFGPGTPPLFGGGP
jgi:hypothetical protein